MHTLELSDFLEQVEGCLLWEEEKQLSSNEELLDWLSWFSANIMLSSGNYKKNTDPLEIKKGLFTSRAESEESNKVSAKEEFETGKAKLLERFKLNEQN